MMATDSYKTVLLSDSYEFNEYCDITIIEAIELASKDAIIELYNENYLLYSRFIKDFNAEIERLYIPNYIKYSVKIKNNNNNNTLLHFTNNIVPIDERCELLEKKIKDKYLCITDKEFKNDALLENGVNKKETYNTTFFIFTGISGDVYNINKLTIKTKCGYNYVFNKDLIPEILNKTFTSDCFDIELDYDGDKKIYIHYTTILVDSNSESPICREIQQYEKVQLKNKLLSQSYENGNKYLIVSNKVRLQGISIFVNGISLYSIYDIGFDFWAKKKFNYRYINGFHYYDITLKISENFKRSDLSVEFKLQTFTNNNDDVSIYNIIKNNILYFDNAYGIRFHNSYLY